MLKTLLPCLYSNVGTEVFINVLELHNTITCYSVADSFNNNGVLWIDVIAYYGSK